MLNYQRVVFNGLDPANPVTNIRMSGQEMQEMQEMQVPEPAPAAWPLTRHSVVCQASSVQLNVILPKTTGQYAEGQAVNSVSFSLMLDMAMMLWNRMETDEREYTSRWLLLLTFLEEVADAKRYHPCPFLCRCFLQVLPCWASCVFAAVDMCGCFCGPPHNLLPLAIRAMILQVVWLHP